MEHSIQQQRQNHTIYHFLAVNKINKEREKRRKKLEFGIWFCDQTNHTIHKKQEEHSWITFNLSTRRQIANKTRENHIHVSTSQQEEIKNIYSSFITIWRQKKHKMKIKMGNDFLQVKFSSLPFVTVSRKIYRR